MKICRWKLVNMARAARDQFNHDADQVSPTVSIYVDLKRQAEEADRLAIVLSELEEFLELVN
jgi:hypothetical protein